MMEIQDLQDEVVASARCFSNHPRTQSADQDGRRSSSERPAPASAGRRSSDGR